MKCFLHLTLKRDLLNVISLITLNLQYPNMVYVLKTTCDK